MEEPKINVGIMFEPIVEFFLKGDFLFSGEIFRGKQKVNFSGGGVEFNGKVFDELLFEPVRPT